MREREFHQSLLRGFKLFESLDLTSWDRFPRPAPLTVDDEFRRVSLSGSSPYEEAYRVGLRNKVYNWILKDFSFFQFGLEGSGPQCSLRFAYFPNPFEYTDELKDIEAELGDTEVHDFQEIAESSFDESGINILKPQVRFDYEPGSTEHLRHAAAHFHIGSHQSCRIPSRKIIGPASFSYFIAKHFYNEEWISAAGASEDLENISDIEAAWGDLCRECWDLPDEYFIAEEFRRLHFSIE